MDWIRVDADFGVPAVRLRVGCRALAVLRNTSRWNADLSRPSEYEAELVRLIETCRPDLRGGCLISVSLRSMWVEMFFVHPSLTKHIQDGTEFPIEDLDPLAANWPEVAG